MPRYMARAGYLALCLSAFPVVAAASDDALNYTCVGTGQWSYLVTYAPNDPTVLDVDKFRTNSIDTQNVETTLEDAGLGLLTLEDDGGLGNGDIQPELFTMAVLETDPMSYAREDGTTTFTHDLESGTLTEISNGNMTNINCALGEEVAGRGDPNNTPDLEMNGMSLGASIFAEPSPNSEILMALDENAGIFVVRDTRIEMDNYNWFAVTVAGVEGYHWGGYMCIPGLPVAGANAC